jgi:hypothetical protein
MVEMPGESAELAAAVAVVITAAYIVDINDILAGHRYFIISECSSQSAASGYLIEWHDIASRCLRLSIDVCRNRPRQG